MIWLYWLEKWKMTSLQITPPFLNIELRFSYADKEAAWEMYIELLNCTGFNLGSFVNDGDEKFVLDSIISLFPKIGEIIKRYGRDCLEFTKLSIVVLSQIIRPFAFKWDRLSSAGAFNDFAQRQQFREDFSNLQVDLRRFTGMLGDMAGVEEDLVLLAHVDVESNK